MKKKNKKVYKSRVARNKKKVRNNDFIILISLIYKLIKLIIKIGYKIIKFIDNIIAKLFMMLPRWSRAIILWSLVISNVYHNFGYEIETTIKNVSYEQVKGVVVRAEEKKESVCSYNNEVACMIEKRGKELYMSDNDIRIMIAISKWETGNWKSQAFKNLNNVGGMMCSSGLIKYDTLEKGVNAFVDNLKYNYFDIGLNDLDKIQKKYCPVGAKNDPTGLNKNWLNGTKTFLQELEGGK